jgi:uncharacterized protein YcbK (DUF882 family)
MSHEICKMRRVLLKAGMALAFTGLNARSAFATFEPRATVVRALSFHNLHTGEKLNAEYWSEGAYLPDALADINHILRDYRNDQVFPIEAPLLDLLHGLRSVLNTTQPFQIISGYRSPATNSLLAASSDGVAKGSLHTQAKAIDLNVEGVQLSTLHRAAVALRGGGVGYYPKSNFVHVDIGRVRNW